MKSEIITNRLGNASIHQSVILSTPIKFKLHDYILKFIYFLQVDRQLAIVKYAKVKSKKNYKSIRQYIDQSKISFCVHDKIYTAWIYLHVAMKYFLPVDRQLA